MTHILLIEDDEEYRTMLSQMLAMDNHKVTTASNGEEGLRKFASERPELVITDILMPSLDGIDVLKKIREAGDVVPVIAISGGRRTITAEFNLDSALLMGARAVLAKPFSRQQLRDAINRALA